MLRPSATATFFVGTNGGVLRTLLQTVRALYSQQLLKVFLRR